MSNGFELLLELLLHHEELFNLLRVRLLQLTGWPAAGAARRGIGDGASYQKYKKCKQADLGPSPSLLGPVAPAIGRPHGLPATRPRLLASTKPHRDCGGTAVLVKGSKVPLRTRAASVRVPSRLVLRWGKSVQEDSRGMC